MPDSQLLTKVVNKTIANVYSFQVLRFAVINPVNKNIIRKETIGVLHTLSKNVKMWKHTYPLPNGLTKGLHNIH